MARQRSKQTSRVRYSSLGAALTADYPPPRPKRPKPRRNSAQDKFVYGFAALVLFVVFLSWCAGGSNTPTQAQVSQPATTPANTPSKSTSSVEPARPGAEPHL